MANMLSVCLLLAYKKRDTYTQQVFVVPVRRAFIIRCWWRFRFFFFFFFYFSSRDIDLNVIIWLKSCRKSPKLNIRWMGENNNGAYETKRIQIMKEKNANMHFWLCFEHFEYPEHQRRITNSSSAIQWRKRKNRSTDRQAKRNQLLTRKGTFNHFGRCINSDFSAFMLNIYYHR